MEALHYEFVDVSWDNFATWKISYTHHTQMTALHYAQPDDSLRQFGIWMIFYIYDMKMDSPPYVCIDVH